MGSYLVQFRRIGVKMQNFVTYGATPSSYFYCLLTSRNYEMKVSLIPLPNAQQCIALRKRRADECDLFCSCLRYSTNVIDPSVYSADLKEMEGVTTVGDVVKEQEVVETGKLWERTYDQQYEKAGGAANGRAAIVKPPVYWDVKKTSIQVTGPCFLGS